MVPLIEKRGAGINRRSFLTATPAVALVAAVPAVAVSATETPIMALFRRHRALWDALQVHPSDDDAELDRLFYDELYRIEDQMFALVSQTPADLAAKMVVAHGHTGAHSCLDFDEYQWAEARALVAHPQK